MDVMYFLHFQIQCAHKMKPLLFWDVVQCRLLVGW